MNRTKIPWVINPDGSPGYTWNPIVGCSPASEGCAHCYAAAMSHRFGRPWGSPVFMPERLDQPYRLKKPSTIFVCSMSDLFHDGVKWDWLDLIGQVMNANQEHTFILLTKRPRMVKEMEIWRLPNIWLGITAENQARYDERWPILESIHAAVRFVSFEPVLGPIYFTPSYWAVDWVIAGPENGPGARPCTPWWIDDLAFACAAEGVPFFDKRDGAGRTRQMPEGYLADGKKT